MPEVDIPTRFFFFYTGPIESEDDQIYSNIGVSLAVALTDKDFAHEVQTSQASLDICTQYAFVCLFTFSCHSSYEIELSSSFTYFKERRDLYKCQHSSSLISTIKKRIL